MNFQLATLQQDRRALEPEPDPAGIGARLNDEVALELALRPPVDEVDTGVQAAIGNRLEAAALRLPLSWIAALI